MQISLIVPIYKQAKELKAILHNLEFQSFKDFELIVAEDDRSAEVLEIVQSAKSSFAIKHHSQEDQGFRKALCLNSAIKIADGDYLIFNDGDCVPHTNFIEAHLSLAQKNQFLSGRRVMLGPGFAEDLMSLKTNITEIQKNYLFDLPKHIKEKTDYYEEGFVFPPNGVWRRLFKPRPMRDVLGANFSFFKEDIYKINGFDEDYTTYGVGDDNDLLWRFKEAGVSFSSTRNTAVTYHLGKHEYAKGEDLVKANREKQKQKILNNEYICKNGLEKLK